MSRYIDADALKANCDIMVGNTTIGRRDYVMFHVIDSAPSIDIVRCRECKYWKSTVQMPNGTEVKCLYGRKADDFCSYGKREGE
jgi:hypothetical protein